MKKEDIKIDDWNRILFGEAPPLYLLETAVKVAIIYLIILIAIRLMGKRMTAELDRADIVARVSLAAAVSLPIQRPGQGLLTAAIIVMVIVITGRLLAAWTTHNTKFERIFNGTYAILVTNGIINQQELKKIQVTQERLFAALRKHGIKHLGQVKRFYIEENGKFSLVKNDKEKPGLAVIPHWDKDLLQQQKQTNIQLCISCGSACENDICKCGGNKLGTAILLPNNSSE